MVWDPGFLEGPRRLLLASLLSVLQRMPRETLLFHGYSHSHSASSFRLYLLEMDPAVSESLAKHL